MPTLRTAMPDTAGPVCILEQKFIVKEQPTVNLGANGTGLTCEQIAVNLAQTFQLFFLGGPMQGFYAAPSFYKYVSGFGEAVRGDPGCSQRDVRFDSVATDARACRGGGRADSHADRSTTRRGQHDLLHHRRQLSRNRELCCDTMHDTLHRRERHDCACGGLQRGFAGEHGGYIYRFVNPKSKTGRARLCRAVTSGFDGVSPHKDQ